MLARPGWWLLAVLTWCSCATLAPPRPDSSRTLSSAVLQEARPYSVSMPDGFSPSRHDVRYPVLYVLDAESHLQLVASVAHFLANVGAIPEVIVVGVPNTDRDRDLTPTHSTVGYDGAEDPRRSTTGGANAFLRFLRSELVPLIDREYPTMPYRVLCGHSAGGLFAAHALVQEPDAFQAVIAAAPSLWFDGGEVVARAREQLGKAGQAPRGRVYVSTSADDPKNNKGNEIIGVFAQLLSTHPAAVRAAKLEHFTRESHQSVELPSVHQGLLFAFEGYELPLGAAHDAPQLVEYYRALSVKLGAEFQPSEAVLGQLAYSLLFDSQQPQQAVGVLELATQLYPGSAANFEHLGEAQQAVGDVAGAVKSFERALALDPGSTESREALTKLRSK